MSEGLRLAQAGESFIGVPFRLHGRDPATGLDCVGLVFASLSVIGRQPTAPSGYRLRNASIERFLSLLPVAGLEPIDGTALPGDVLLTNPGPAQHHLMIVGCAKRLIHAHAGLRRVVSEPHSTPLNLAAHWRLAELDKEI